MASLRKWIFKFYVILIILNLNLKWKQCKILSSVKHNFTVFTGVHFTLTIASDMHERFLCLGLEVAPFFAIIPLIILSYMTMQLWELGNKVWFYALEEDNRFYCKASSLSYSHERKKKVYSVQPVYWKQTDETLEYNGWLKIIKSYSALNLPTLVNKLRINGTFLAS